MWRLKSLLHVVLLFLSFKISESCMNLRHDKIWFSIWKQQGYGSAFADGARSLISAYVCRYSLVGFAKSRPINLNSCDSTRLEYRSEHMKLIIITPNHNMLHFSCYRNVYGHRILVAERRNFFLSFVIYLFIYLFTCICYIC